MSSFGERLKLVRGSLSQAEFSKRLGIPQVTLGNYERDRNEPKFETLKKICSLFGIKSDWLLFGVGSMTDGAETPSLTKSACDVDLIMVPMVEARLSAGTGSLQVDGDIERSYAFRSDFLHRKGNPANMVMMRVEGDSMQPEIMNNDVVLLDQSKKEVRTGRLFAVGFENVLRVFVLALS